MAAHRPWYWYVLVVFAALWVIGSVIEAIQYIQARKNPNLRKRNKYALMLQLLASILLLVSWFTT